MTLYEPKKEKKGYPLNANLNNVRVKMSQRMT